MYRYLLHLSRPQRDGRALGTVVSERQVDVLMRAFEVKTAKVRRSLLSSFVSLALHVLSLRACRDCNF